MVRITRELMNWMEIRAVILLIYSNDGHDRLPTPNFQHPPSISIETTAKDMRNTQINKNQPGLQFDRFRSFPSIVPIIFANPLANGPIKKKNY